MSGFLSDLVRFHFLQYAVATGVLASVACGIVGGYVTTRRLTYVAGALAHCALGGMGLARYLARAHGLEMCTPLGGALAAVLAAALLISWIETRGGMRRDSLLSAIWAVGMAIGIVFIARTPGYNEDLMSYLFGDILMVSGRDLGLIAVLDGGIVAGAALCHNRLAAIAFDEDFALISGIPVALYNTLFYCMVGLTVVLLVQVVGIVLVVALLTLPAAAAGLLCTRLGPMMGLAMVLSMASCLGGLVVSYGLDLPAGAVIILGAAGLYLLAAALERLPNRGRRR